MIIIKTKKEIEIIKENAIDLAKIMKRLKNEVRPGINTLKIERLAKSLILEKKAKPSFLGYGGFPSTLCVSINEEIVHGIPSNRILKQGDILSLDIGMKRNGYHSDMAVTVPVGNISPEAKRLIKTTKKALKRGISKIKIKNTIGDIGNCIQRHIESQGYGVVRDLCGHGIGKGLHEDPQILNYGKRHSGEKIKKGMVFCIEPMATSGDWHIKKSKNNFAIETKDGSMSAHFEHMVVVTEKGSIVLTEID